MKETIKQGSVNRAGLSVDFHNYKVHDRAKCKHDTTRAGVTKRSRTKVRVRLHLAPKWYTRVQSTARRESWDSAMASTCQRHTRKKT
jgi:hypothetical protein